MTLQPSRPMNDLEFKKSLKKFKFQRLFMNFTHTALQDPETNTLFKSLLKNSFPIMKTTPIFQVKFPLNEGRDSLRIDKQTCLAKCLIFHSVWQIKRESLSLYINIYEKWHNVPFGKQIWGKCYIQQSQLRLSGLQSASAGMPLNREGKLPINVEFLL